eukprot:g31962.t1
MRPRLSMPAVQPVATRPRAWRRVRLHRVRTHGKGCKCEECVPDAKHGKGCRCKEKCAPPSSPPHVVPFAIPPSSPPDQHGGYGGQQPALSPVFQPAAGGGRGGSCLAAYLAYSQQQATSYLSHSQQQSTSFLNYMAGGFGLALLTWVSRVGWRGELRQKYSINVSLHKLEGVKLNEECTSYFKANRLYAKILEQNNLQGRRSQLMADFFRAVKADSLENFNRFMTMPEIKTAEKHKATPDILLQNAARVGLLTACKALTSSEEFDLDKAAARKAGAEPAYESPTCSVWMAEDMKAENAQNAKVALKLIQGRGSRENFDREAVGQGQSLAGVLVGLLRTHEKELCLVMPAAPASLNDFLRRRNVSGRDPVAVRAIAVAVARCLQALHACGLVHGDLKPNNVVSLDGVAQWKLIDFDAAAQFGQPMADEPPAPEEPEQPRQEDPEVKTSAENLGDLLIGRITLGNIPKELGGDGGRPVEPLQDRIPQRSASRSIRVEFTDGLLISKPFVVVQTFIIFKMKGLENIPIKG